MSVHKNIKKLQYLKNELNKHPMAFDVKEENGKLVVLFPYSVNNIDGLSVCLSIGKIISYQRALDKCEHYWKLDNPVLHLEYCNDYKNAKSN